MGEARKCLGWVVGETDLLCGGYFSQWATWTNWKREPFVGGLGSMETRCWLDLVPDLKRRPFFSGLSEPQVRGLALSSSLSLLSLALSGGWEQSRTLPYLESFFL